MIWFHQRKQMTKLFDEWCGENGAENCSESFVAWLLMQGWLNEEKIIKDLSGKGERNGSDV